MALQSLGTQHRVKRAGLEVEFDPTKTSSVLPTADTLFKGVRGGPTSQAGHPQDEVDQVSGSPFLCSKEKLLQNESNFGLVHPQQPYPMRQVPDAHYNADKDPATTRGLRNLHRSYRRLLACPSSAPLLPLPWICTRPSGLRIQSYALRAKYSTKDLHQADGSTGSSTQAAGYPSSSLPGRLAHLGTVSRGVQESRDNCDQIPSSSGVSGQLQEIPIRTTAVIHLAGPSVGSVSPSGFSSNGQTEGDCSFRSETDEGEEDDEEATGESSGLSSVRVNSGSDSESQAQRYEQSLEDTSESDPSGSGEEDPWTPAEAVETMVDSQEPVKIHSAEVSCPFHNHPYGCLTQRMGGTLSEQVCSGEVVSNIPVVSYQHPRSDGSVLDSEENQPQEGVSCSHCVGQQYNSSLYQSERFQVTPDQPCGSSNSIASKEEAVASQCSPLRRGPQCDRGCPVQRCSPGIRVEPGRGVFSVHPRPGSGPRGRPVCNVDEPSTADLHCPERRPGRGRDGRSINRVESVEENLHVPASQPSDEGAGQTENFSGNSSHSGSPMATKQLVSTGSGNEPQTGSPTDTSPQPVSTEEACLSFILANPEASLVDFLEIALGKRRKVQPVNVKFTEDGKALTTHRQYQSWWKRWMAFVTEQQPQSITEDFCLSFFRSLHEEGLAASTLKSLKSAISKPIRYAFNVDLTDDLFANAMKACSRRRPAPRPTSISWSLDKVLEMAATIELDCRDVTKQLRKTVFLVTLALGARISEVAALRRGEDFVRLLPSGEMRLVPDRSFLAKNELPDDRWDPWLLVPLQECPALCPVANLQHYLNLTRTYKEGQLFRGETTGSSLSIAQLRAKIIYFVNTADPDGKPDVHHLRKIATSLNFMEYLDFEDLKRYTGWKSTKVFFKHYLKNIEGARLPLVAAGKVVRPK